MDLDLKKRVLSVIESFGLNNLFIAQAKKADSFFKPRIIVAINDRCLMTFNIKGTKTTNQFSWLTTKYIGRELNKLRFQFDKVKFAFECTEEALFRAVWSSLQNILTNSELKAIKFDQFNFPPIYSYPPSSALNRIKERAILLKEQVYDNTLEHIKSILIYSQPDVNISEIPGIDKFLSIILDSLPFWSNIQVLTISEMGIIDPYEVCQQYASYFNSLKLLEMNCKKSEDFQAFMTELSRKDENQPRNLYGLSFIRSEFEKDELNTLQQFIISENIQCLELHDAINRNTMLHFYTQFLAMSMMKNLKILNLDHTKNISNDISVIAPKCSNLIALSLADCGIEVSEVLFQLSRLLKLRTLNLSNNTCRKVINGLPPNVTTLYLNSVNWCFQTLQLFLTNLPRHHLTLHLSNISMQQNSDYDDLFVKLPTSRSNFLTGLSWDGNRIEQSLFDFLGKNRYLQFLSLSNCFSKDNEKEVTMFQNYLTQFHTLKKLIIQGSKKKYLGNLVELVINGILRSPQIEFLDITQNKSGDFGLTQMRRLLSFRTSLRCFIFDRTKPTSFKALSSFLTDSTQYRNLRISFPLKDMRSMLKKGKINEDQFSQIQSHFISSTKPECIYIEFYNNDFPRFFSPAEIEELSKPVDDFEAPKNPPQQERQERQEQKQAGTPKSKQNTTSYNVNYNFGTLNMKALKSTAKNDLLPDNGSPSRRERERQQQSPNKTSNQNDYLLRQNRKIAKMTPKESNDFDSESASYNQESSSNDFFIPNNYNNDFEAQTVKNRPIRNNLKPSTKQKVTKTKRTNKAASLAPVKKRKQQQHRNRDNDDDNDEVRETGSARRTRKTVRSTASSQRPKTTRKNRTNNRFIFDDNNNEIEEIENVRPTPNSTRSRRSAASRKKVRRVVNNNDDDIPYDDDDYGYDNDRENHADNNVRPVLRTKKAAASRRRTNRDFFNRDDDDELGEEEDQRLLVTYQLPKWDFPLKMKFVYETDTVKRIEEKYSDNSFVSLILSEIEERPSQRNTVSNKRK